MGAKRSVISKKVVMAEDLLSPDDGETVEFGFELEDGSREAFVSSHSAMVEIADALLKATKICAEKRRRLGKTYEPLPQDGVVRNVDLSSFAVLLGHDGLPRLIWTQDNGSTIVIRLTKADAERWRELLNEIIGDDSPANR